MRKDFYHIHLQFQNFMLAKGYRVREREKLTSPIFPTTFTMSGGPDLAYKFWQGDESLRGNHIVNQPCIRHWDIEKTGDKKHLSFFNMFVADSVTGFSRLELISHFMELFTGQLKMDPARFYASYFGGGEVKGHHFDADSAMREIWLSVGVPESRVFSSLSDQPMEAFVANTVEPVGGPRAELFYDLRKQAAPITSAEDFWRLEQQGEMLEFFTHVMYNLEVSSVEDASAVFTPMRRQAFAAGFGPQRLLEIFENVDIGNISILSVLKNCLGSAAADYELESIIVCDHIRGIVFLIHDDITAFTGNKNRSRRYLFRKYLKNFKDNFDKLPLENPEETLDSLIDESINLFSVLFPTFSDRRYFIKSTLQEKLKTL